MRCPSSWLLILRSSALGGAGMHREYRCLFQKKSLGNPAIIGRVRQIGGFASRPFERFASLIERGSGCRELPNPSSDDRRLSDGGLKFDGRRTQAFVRTVSDGLNPPIAARSGASQNGDSRGSCAAARRRSKPPRERRHERSRRARTRHGYAELGRAHALLHRFTADATREN